ncbi:hypothetical protein HK101_008521 [Irineochytrium annulatum]|nr:hypothetical protein HK101_008521 [Irineochytrium annulatum]
MDMASTTTMMDPAAAMMNQMCFTVTDSKNMPDFNSASILVSAGTFMDTATLDSWLSSNMDTNTTYVAGFNQQYGCNWDGHNQRFHISFTAGMLSSISLSHNPPCPVSFQSSVKPLCQQTCQMAHAALSNIFMNSTACPPNTDPTGMRVTALNFYTEICNTLPTTNCLPVVQAEMASCGFPVPDDAVAYCAPGGMGAATFDSCCSSSQFEALQARLNGTLSDSAAAPPPAKPILFVVIGASGAVVLVLVLAAIYITILNSKNKKATMKRKASKKLKEAKRNSRSSRRYSKMKDDPRSSSPIRNDDGRRGREADDEERGNSRRSYVPYRPADDSRSRSRAPLDRDRMDDRRRSQSQPRGMGGYDRYASAMPDNIDRDAATLRDRDARRRSHSRDPRDRARDTVLTEVTALPPMAGGGELPMLPRSSFSPMLDIGFGASGGGGGLTVPAIAIGGGGSGTDSMLPSGVSDVEICKVRVVFDYTAAMSDELDLNPGDIVSVTGMFDDGWAHGVIGNSRGAFPLACVESMDSGSLQTQKTIDARRSSLAASAYGNVIHDYAMLQAITLALAGSVIGLVSVASAATGPPKDAEAFLQAHISADRIRDYHHYYTSKAHVAGTEADREQAEWTRERWQSFGFDDVSLAEYEVPLNLPGERSLTLIEPTRFEASLTEAYIEEDEASHDQQAVPTFHGYGASGDVTGEIVYAGYGRKQDYDLLQTRGIDLRGKIALVRYGQVFRGLKVRGAELAGMKACIIYSDPADDGFSRGKVYPEGKWRPPTGVQRGSVQYVRLTLGCLLALTVTEQLSIFAGDPTTPFEPSWPNATRVPLNETLTIPKIPSLPISYGDAEPLLRALKGHGLLGKDIEESWQGGLDFDYWTGYDAVFVFSLSTYRLTVVVANISPGPAIVHLKVEQDYTVKPIWNVIGKIRGSTEPDRAVFVGNHRDAWVRGAADPSSGSASLMELAFALGELLKTGWRPKRTIVLASWDAEEYGLVGSTEFVEEFKDRLNATAIAYLNMDVGSTGPHFQASASPALAQLIRDVTKSVKDPNTGKTVYEAWSSRYAGVATGDLLDDSSSEPLPTAPSVFTVHPSRDATFSALLANPPPAVGDLGSGSDYTAFLQHVGISSIDIGFSGMGDGIYHSNYDSFRWMEKFGDPGHTYHAVGARVLALMLLRIATGKVLPFDVEEYGRALEEQAAMIEAAVKGAGLEDVKFKGMTDAVRGYSKAARSLAKVKEQIEGKRTGGRFMIQDDDERLFDSIVAGKELAAVNDKLAFAERQTFPAIREAVEEGSSVVQQRVDKVVEILRRAVEVIAV